MIKSKFFAIATILFLATLGLLSCQGNSPTQSDHSLTPLNDNMTNLPQVAMENLLLQELKRLGKDPEREPSSPPSGEESRVFNLEGKLLPGSNEFSVQLTWVERLAGDYDQNGEVNISDLTPLGLKLGTGVSYFSSEDKNGVGHWPKGDPSDFGGDTALESPSADSGAYNWRLARIDGDGNGEINAADITPIAINWKKGLNGYRLYRRGPGQEDAELVAESGMLLTISRPPPDHPDAPVVYEYTTTEQAIEGEYEYYVVPFDEKTKGEGEASNILSISIGKPIANLVATPVNEVIPVQVELDASGSMDVGGSIVKYEWDWDHDGTFEVDLETTEPLTNTTYENFGTYHPAVRVTDNDGFQHKATTQVELHNSLPIAVIEASLTSGEPPLAVVLDASLSSDLDGEIVLYEWDWDFDGAFQADETSTEAMISHEFSDSGTYLPAVRVTDNNDGTDIGIIETSILANRSPTAELAADPLEGKSILRVAFDATGSSDEDGQITQYDWDFGDGVITFDSGPAPWHDYQSPGTYDVELVVTDNYGATGSSNVSVNVYGNLPPEAALTSNLHEGSSPLTIQFDASESHDPDGRITLYEWDWDYDGTFNADDSGIYPLQSHTFMERRVHTVAVRTKDDNDAADIATNDIVCGIWTHRQVSEEIPNGVWDACLVNDQPAFTYVYGRTIRYSRSLDQFGISWGVPTSVAVWPTGSGWRVEGGSSIAVVNGTPEIMFSAVKGSPDWYWTISRVFSSDENGYTWSSPQDFLTGSEAICPDGIVAAEINGSIAASLNHPDNGLRYRREAGGSINLGYDVQDIQHQLEYINNSPSIAWVYRTPWQEGPIEYKLMYTSASNKDGTAWWPQPVELATTEGRGRLSLDVVAGNPAISFGRVSYVRAMDQDGSSWGESIQVHPEGNNPSLAVISGVPHIAFYINKTILLASALDETGSAWNTAEVIVEATGADPNPALLNVSGQPGLIYVGTGGTLHYSVFN